LWPSEGGQRVAGHPCFIPAHYAQARNRPPPAARDPWRARGEAGRFSTFQWRSSARRHTHRHEHCQDQAFRRRGKATWTFPAKKLRPGTYQLTASYASSNGYDPVTSAKKKFVVTR